MLAACTTLPEYEDFVRDAANATKREKTSAADGMRKRLRERMAYVLSQASADATLLEALGPLTAARAGVGSSSGTEGGLTNEDSMEVDSLACTQCCAYLLAGSDGPIGENVIAQLI